MPAGVAMWVTWLGMVWGSLSECLVEGPVISDAEEDTGAAVGDARGPVPMPVTVGGVGEIELPGGGAPEAAAGSALLPVTARTN